MTTSLESRCRVDTSRIGAGSAVEVTGILDWHSAPQLRAAFSPFTPLAPGKRLLVDLTDVERIDSSGTGELIARAVWARHKGIEIGIVTGSATTEVLESVGLGDSALVFSDRASAYSWVAGERAGYPLGR